MLEGVTETRAQLPSRHLKAELKELRENKESSIPKAVCEMVESLSKGVNYSRAYTEREVANP